MAIPQYYNPETVPGINPETLPRPRGMGGALPQVPSASSVPKGFNPETLPKGAASVGRTMSRPLGGGALGNLGAGGLMAQGVHALATSGPVVRSAKEKYGEMTSSGEDVPVWYFGDDNTPQQPAPQMPQGTKRPGDVEDYLGKAQQFAGQGGLTTRLDDYAQGQIPHGIFRESAATAPVYASRMPEQQTALAPMGGRSGVGGALNIAPAEQREEEAAPKRGQATPLPTWEDMFAKYLQMAGGGRSFASANLVNQFASGAAASQLNSLAGNAARQRANEKDMYQEWKDRQALKMEGEKSALEKQRLGLQTKVAEKELSALGPQGLNPLQQAQMEEIRARTAQMGTKEEMAREKMMMNLRAQANELPVGSKERELAEQQLSILEQGQTPEYYYQAEQAEQNNWTPEFLGGKPDVPYRAEQYGYRAKPKKKDDKTALGQPTYGIRG